MMLLQASLNRTTLSLSAAADLARRQPLTPARSPGQNPNDLGPSSTFAVDGGSSSFSLSDRPRHIGPDLQSRPLDSHSMLTSSGSSVSLGSGPHAYNQNRAFRDLRRQTNSDLTSAFESIRALEDRMAAKEKALEAQMAAQMAAKEMALEAQMAAKMAAKETEQQRAFAALKAELNVEFAALRAEMEATVEKKVQARAEATLADRTQEIQKAHQLEKENVRREIEALRKKCARQQKRLEGIDAAGLAAHKAQPGRTGRTFFSYSMLSLDAIRSSGQLSTLFAAGVERG